MAGVQVAGLVSGLNWQNVINELVTADSAGMNQVKTQQTVVNNQVSALGGLSTDLTSLQSSIFTLESPTLYSAVTASSNTSGSTWSINAESGSPIGSYAINVQNLATASKLAGAGDRSNGLNPSDNVAGLTIANVATAQPITAGNFTIDGQQVAVTTAESLQDVFDAISSATGGTVTGSYDPAADKVSLQSTAGPILLGAANDSSNFLTTIKLQNNDGTLVTSSATLGTLQLSNPITSSGLKTALSGQDGSGNGSFTVNGVAINYNINTDSLKTILGRINNSGANVNASYDSTDDQILLTNTTTGNLGVSVSDTSGNLAAALGLTSGAGAALTRGVDAQYTINGGPTQSSESNTLTAAQLNVTGLNVSVNTTGLQTIQVATDTSGITTAIQNFITSFNQLQADISNDTNVSTSATGVVSTSVLSADHEVGDWGSSLQMRAFSAGSGLTTAIKSLDALGIDFNGTSGQLEISNSAQLQQALSSNTSAVAAFFQTATTGFGSIMNSAVIDVVGQNASETQNLQANSTDLGNQIATMQRQLTAEQNTLEAEFQAMETAESQYQSQLSALNAVGSGSGGSSNSSSSSNVTGGLSNSNVYVNGVSNSGTSSTSSTG